MLVVATALVLLLAWLLSHIDHNKRYPRFVIPAWVGLISLAGVLVAWATQLATTRLIGLIVRSDADRRWLARGWAWTGLGIGEDP
jgi:cell division protein FtsW (lipid II flippase)